MPATIEEIRKRHARALTTRLISMAPLIIPQVEAAVEEALVNYLREVVDASDEIAGEPTADLPEDDPEEGDSPS